MDPLSFTASVITVIRISKEILTLCGRYVSDVKHAKKDIECLSGEVMALQDILNRVKDLAEGPDAAMLPTLNALNVAIDQCSSELEGLKTRLDPGKVRLAMNQLRVRLKWPFKSEDVKKCIAALERSKTTITLALSAGQRLETTVIHKQFRTS
jgi:hypothetical protein